MNCPGCQRPNAAARRYCGGCGHNLDPVCRGCYFVNDADDRFCGGCGAGMVVGVVPQQVAAVPQVAATAASLALPPKPPPMPPVFSSTSPLPVEAAAPMPAPAPAPRPAPAPVKVAEPLPDELAGLFVSQTTVKAPALPDANIAQDDLDKLFGVGA
jgi:hypothetical protein